MNTRTSLSILGFNVEGLDSILLDPQFHELINDHDICFLTETMKKDESKLNLPNFWDHSLTRVKTKKAGRYSGGITVLVKSELRVGIKVAHSSEGFLWIRLLKDVFHLEHDLYMCGIYIPPSNSDKELLSKVDYFGDLLSQITRFGNMGNVMLVGDLNSRVGFEGSDAFEHDIPFINNILPSFCLSPSIPTRSSCDSTVNQNGRKLTNICKSLNLYIANGRTQDDMLGNYTCHTSRGSSVVDLVIADQFIIKNIERLKVLPPDFTSVHSPISANLHCSLPDATRRKTVIPLPPKIIWDPSKIDNLREGLLNPLSLRQLEELTLALTDPNSSSSTVDSTVSKFNTLLVGEAKRHMKQSRKAKFPRNPNIKTRREKHKWYGSDCASAKARLKNLATLLMKNPKDPYIRGKYIVVKKQYRKIVKLAKKHSK